MSKKFWISILVFAGSTIGGYIPTLFGAGFLSYTALFMSGVGGIIGIWIGYQLGE